MVEKAIEPIVKECLEKFVANDQADVISYFRSQCLALTTTTEELQWMNRELHQPTMDLREGHVIGRRTVQPWVAEMKQRLEAKRQEG